LASRGWGDLARAAFLGASRLFIWSLAIKAMINKLID
jgi:hypothetical protein